MRGNPKTHAFCYLYNEAPCLHQFRRDDEKTVSLFLPRDDDIRVQMEVAGYDHRDQRALIIFDGDIPWCGLPKAADEASARYLMLLRSTSSHQRKRRGCELNPPYQDGGSEIVVPLYRRALLLPAGKSLIMRYRERSLAGWYSLVTVKRQSEDAVDVEFINSDY